MKASRYLIFILSLAACHKKTDNIVVTTFAGNGIMKLADGNGVQASFGNLMGITVDANGNVYVADSHNNVIRKINPGGEVTTLAGSGTQGAADGKGREASFFYPTGITVDKNGNLFVCDTHNNLIRKISPDGVVTTISGKRRGNDSLAFDNPAGIAVDVNGNLYVGDWGNDVVKKISPAGAVTNYAGTFGVPGSKDGMGDSASFYLPWGIAVDSPGNIYVSDFNNNMIRKISAAGRVTTIAGRRGKGAVDGPCALASFFHPAGIAIDKQNNIYVADMGNNKIRKISSKGMVTTLAGSGIRGSSDGRDTMASFNRPYGIALDTNGSLYVADYLNNVVRKITY